MLPGDAGARRPLSNNTFVATPVMPHCDDGEHEDRLHEHVREVDLVDATEELDDDRTGCARLGDADTEDREREEQTEAGAGVRLDEEEEGLARLTRRLLRADRGEHAVVDGVVEEEDLARLDEDRDEGQEAETDEPVDRCLERVAQGGDDGSEGEDARDREDRRQDTGREVVDEHLEAGLDLAGPQLVDLLHEPRGERAHDHRAEEHRDRRAGDHTDSRDRADDTTAGVVDHTATRVGDEEGQEVGDHRTDETGPDATIGRFATTEDWGVLPAPGLDRAVLTEPAGRDEHRGDEAPRDERADVRHDHAAEERAEALDSDSRSALGACRSGRRN
jgi:hypothetical protein